MGCFGTKASPVEDAYVPAPKQNEPDRASEQSQVDSKRSSVDHPKPALSRKVSQRGSVDVNASDQKIQEEIKAAVAVVGEKPVVKRGKTTADLGSLMWALKDEVQPFTQVEVKWKLKGVKANEADWIGMYDGLDIPTDIDVYASSMMATGKNEGSVKFTAPNHHGLHHFRYFLLDDTEAAVSGAFMITKLEKGAGDNIHVRDAVMAEDEVARIEGTLEEEDEEEEDMLTTENGPKKVRKKKEDGPTVDVTGFELDENSAATQGAESVEKWKEEAREVKAMEAESTMIAATNYVKKIPTKKEMRAAAAAKLASSDAGGKGPNRGSQEHGITEAVTGGLKKKPGWGAVRGAVKAAAGFQQGRANKSKDDGLKGRKQSTKGTKGTGEDMGSFVINRKKA